MIDLYKPSPSPLAMHYPIMIDGDITDTEHYREEFDMILQASEGDLITILVSSNGGSLSTGLRFYSLLKETPAHTVAIIETHAHSAASIIALGCDEIRAQPYAEMLIHSCSYGTGGLDFFDLPSSWKNNKERQSILDEYDYEFMEGNTGGEGEGEYCYGVIRFRGNYYKAEWSYYSYNGCDYDNITSTIREVFPKQVMVTQYSDKP